jgi:hypothetical protein
MPTPNEHDREEIADASLLFGSAGSSSSGESPKPATAASHEPGGYDVEDVAAEVLKPNRPAPPIEDRPARPTNAPRPHRPTINKSSGVEQVWTRLSEWGQHLLILAIALMGSAFLLWQTFSVENLGTWVMLFLICLGGLIVLCYPLFITLERPVRMTPEQAVNDYYAALSHHLPHFKRMWLLLAIDGRDCSSFHNYTEFCAYWKTLLAKWKAEAKVTAPLNPIQVVISDFKSEKSGGQTELAVSYTAVVQKRGSQTKLATFRIEAQVVRGPDRMWYLDAGTLE